MKRIAIVLAAAVSFAAGVAYADPGQEAWEKKCASCHGKDGKGDTKMGAKLKVRDLSAADVQAKFTDDEATKSVTEGIEEKKMPAFKGKLSDDEIKAVVAFTRTLKK